MTPSFPPRRSSVLLAATFERGGRAIRVPGFYDGSGVYRIRFSPPDAGRWTWQSESNAAALAGQAGAFDCTAPAPGNHGPVRVTGDGLDRKSTRLNSSH